MPSQGSSARTTVNESLSRTFADLRLWVEPRVDHYHLSTTSEALGIEPSASADGVT